MKKGKSIAQTGRGVLGAIMNTRVGRVATVAMSMALPACTINVEEDTGPRMFDVGCYAGTDRVGNDVFNSACIVADDKTYDPLYDETTLWSRGRPVSTTPDSQCYVARNDYCVPGNHY
jgi:hypothetical protein